MKDTLRNKCDLFADNYLELSKSFKWNYTTNLRLGALLYAMENRVVDTDAIKRCRKVIKEKTGIFSQFQDSTNFMTSVMLSLQSEPEAILKSALSVYDAMKMEGFHASPYLVLAAISIALQADPYNYQKIIRSAKSFYDAMKEEHRFITSSDDYGFAALLAMTDKSVSETVREMERCYRILKEDFSYSNAVQSLTHILTFSDEEAASKCRRVVKLYQALKERNCKFSGGIEFSFLGVIALLNQDVEKLADEIKDVSEYLQGKKGFGFWAIAKKERIMFAMAVVCGDYLDLAKMNTMEMALSNSVAGIIIAEQMAAMAAASGAAAAAAASN